MSVTLQGRAAAPGAAMAPAFLLRERDDAQATSDYRPAGDPDEERARADTALATTAERLTALAEDVAESAGESEAEVFLAHADFAEDPELIDRIHDEIAAGADAVAAVRAGFDSFRQLLAGSPDEYLAARAGDIDDVRDQVLDVLLGRSQDTAVPQRRSVLVARELTPSQTARLPRELIAAVACEGGSPTSHAAILARTLGIPAVLGVSGLLEAVTDGQLVAVDGSSGEVVVDPGPERRARIDATAEQAASRRSDLAALAGEPGRTADGHRVELAANVDGPDALAAAAEHGAEGSGLVRTELLFLEAREAPSVQDQAAYYRRVLAAFPGQRVVFRTMDIGADKPLPFAARAPEENPALGVRGIRLGLEQPELLRDQLRALLRAASLAARDGETARLAVMFPLVAVRRELDAALALLAEAAAAEEVDLDKAGIEVGTMIEVPSAALAARALAERCDFLSIGTNDLLQYLFAADRLLPAVADLPQLFEPTVLRLVRDVADAAAEHGAWLGVCGEEASDPVSAIVLVGLGVAELSMTPSALPEVKAALRQVTLDDCRQAARRALEAADAEEARSAVAALLS